jgi:hypothetical protein
VILGVLFATLIVASVAKRNSERRRLSSSPLSSATSSRAPAISGFSADSRSDIQLDSRPIFPYSVIPGGVESAEELRNALAHDPVVADHYKGFDSAKAHFARLDHDRAVYVSYRMGDRVYWTKNRLMLREGETLVTDGAQEARARCGNRVSDLAMAPVTPAQPSAQAMEALPAPELLANAVVPFDLPDVFPASPISTPATPLASPPAGGILIPPPVFPIVGGGPSPTPGTTPLPPPVLPPSGVPIPEPGTLPLLLAGFLTLGLTGWVAQIRKKRKA